MILMLAFISALTTVSKVSAQEYGPTDFLYTSQTFNAYLKLNINDEIQAVYFATGDKWLEYDVISVDYLGQDKGWVINIRDGFGNDYVIKKPTLEGNISVSPIKGKEVKLVRVKNEDLGQ